MTTVAQIRARVCSALNLWTDASRVLRHIAPGTAARAEWQVINKRCRSEAIREANRLGQALNAVRRTNQPPKRNH